MLIKPLAAILFVASSFILVTGQAPNAADPAKSAGGTSTVKPRDMPVPAGVDLQFLVKELARDAQMNAAARGRL